MPRTPARHYRGDASRTHTTRGRGKITATPDRPRTDGHSQRPRLGDESTVVPQARAGNHTIAKLAGRRRKSATRARGHRVGPRRSTEDEWRLAQLLRRRPAVSAKGRGTMVHARV